MIVCLIAAKFNAWELPVGCVFLVWMCKELDVPHPRIFTDGTTHFLIGYDSLRKGPRLTVEFPFPTGRWNRVDQVHDILVSYFVVESDRIMYEWDLTAKIKIMLFTLQHSKKLLVIVSEKCSVSIIRVEVTSTLKINLLKLSRSRSNTKTLHSTHRVYSSVSYDFYNKQRVFPYSALNGWSLQRRHDALPVRYGLSFYILLRRNSVLKSWQ
jgi:hypothetical protein